MDNLTIMAVQDIPLGESGAEDQVDQLGVKPYVEALQAFILSCGTPMTVAIQGDWGTGKTSMMRQIEKNIQPTAHCVWFNTWQYSQFAQTDTLPLTFLSAIAERIATKGTGPLIKQTVNSLIKTFAPKLLGAALKMGANALTGGVAGEMLDSFTEDTPEKKEAKPKPEVIDASKLLEKLKGDFALACAAKCEESGKSRIVVFVDDLDRIKPARAIELLETLKMFLDVEKCVFVLALDYAVVMRGLVEKFGVSEKDLGRSFFDKIIQLPFTMPTGSYKLEKYLEDLLSRVGFTTHKKRIENYMELLQNSIGANPRSIKRLVNVVTLMNIVFSKQKDAPKVEGQEFTIIEDDAHREILLFAFVCLQTAYEPLYGHFLAHFDAETLKKLCTSKEYDEQTSGLGKAAAAIPGFNDKRERVEQFMNAFYAAMDKDGNKTIDESEMQAMRCMMHSLSVTAVESQQIQLNPGSSVKDDIITQMCLKAKDDFLEKAKFDLVYVDKHAATNGSRTERIFYFHDGRQIVQIELSAEKTGSGFKELEHTVTLSIYLDEDSFDGKTKKAKKAKCAEFLAILKEQGLKDWELDPDEENLNAGICFTIEDQRPGPELAKQIADKLVEGYGIFNPIAEKWAKQNPTE